MFVAAGAGAGADAAATASAADALLGSALIKLVGSSRARFVPAGILVGDTVAHLAARVSLLLDGGMDAYMDLFLVPGSLVRPLQLKPSEYEGKVALL